MGSYLSSEDEGLQIRTPTMCQISTYITRAANGMEMMCRWDIERLLSKPS